ncbi:DsbA family protein [Falsigemmobacter intermedius]|uniref:DsbA family protein n=1 Tax=Falsigemmobacter intermedius TaxID=1553448 RepID=UPI003F09E3D9
MLTRRRMLTMTGGFLLLPRALAAQDEDLRALTHTPDQPVLGNPDGDVTLIEFYDYQCPFCRKIHGEVTELVRRDGRIRLVMKDWPIFGDSSVFAHKVGLAAVSMGKYEAVHNALMSLPGRRLAEADIARAAKSAGVEADAAAALFDRQADRWMPLIWRNEQQAQQLGLQGTPAFMAGRAIYPGAASLSTLRGMVQEARRG